MKKKKGVTHTRIDLKLILLFGLILGMGLTPALDAKDCGVDPCPGTSPAVWPHRSAPLGDTVRILGWNLDAGTAYDIVIIRPDGAIVTGDGSGVCASGAEDCWDTVTTDNAGELLQSAYSYVVGDVPGVYQVLVYASPWSGDLNEIPIASTNFFKWANE